MPEHYDPQVILPVGYPLVKPQSTPKKQTEMEYLAVKNTCACGCGKQLVSLNPQRKFFHGHAKFGKNGLFKVLKSPPVCKCGCGMTTDWDWEKMKWKKYIDSHIGLRRASMRKSSPKVKQFDMFK